MHNAPSTPAPKVRILIVEDEIIVARDLQMQLRELGYEPVGLTDRGETALELMETLQPDLVLMDIHLAGAMDGVMTAEIIRKNYARPVVYLTAFAENDTIARAKLTEPFGYILKPFSERELHTVIEMALYKASADRALHESLERVRTIIATEPECVKVVDAQSLLLEMNPAGLAMLEADNLAQATAHGLLNFITPEYRVAFSELNRRVLAGESGRLVFEVIGLRGTRRWLETSAAPLRDPTDRVTALLGITRDITARKHQEAAAKHRADFLAELSQIIRDLLTQRELADLLPAAVAQAAQVFAATQASILLKEGAALVVRATWSRAAGAVTMAAMVVPDDLDPAWVAFTGAQARQTYVHTAAVHSAHPFHAPIGAAILYVPIRLGDEGLGLLGLIRQESDFTPQEIDELEQLADALALILHNAQLLADLREDIRRRELLERQLEVNEKRFASVIDSSMDAIITVNSGRQILIFNPAAEQMFRLPRVQALGQPLDRFIPARLRSSHRQLIDAFAASAPTALALGRTLAITGLRADGEEFPAEASISHMRVGEDQLSTVMLRDITARERIEREKKLVEDQLRQSQKLEAIGQLAGGIAHDFNNLLTAILGNASLLQDSRHPPALQQEMLRQIAQAGNRAATLTRQLLLFSRRQEAVRQNFDLNQVVAEMLKLLRSILGEQIELSVAFAAQPQLIHADSGMLDQVLLNLSVNARDAMPDGGKLHICTEAISLRLDEATGRLKAWQGGQWLPDSGRPFQESPGSGAPVNGLARARTGEFTCLSVTDEGTGMTPAVMEHIFEPFFTTKKAGQGTGLGLATVYGIVQQHQGWIEVASQPKAGTTFRVFLPLLAADSALAEAAPQVAADLAGHGETIMVVEDEASVRNLLRILLEQAGYRVLLFASGVEAAAHWPALQDQVNLLITDMVMPGGTSGLDLAQTFHGDRPGLRVIVISGYNTKLSKDGWKANPAMAFLPKPFDLQVVLAQVRALLDQKGPTPL